MCRGVYDEEAVDVLAKFTRLKGSPMPYIYQIAVQAHQFGTPTLWAMMLAFPGGPACETLDRQYMLGDAVLVAPVFREGAPGKWNVLVRDGRSAPVEVDGNEAILKLS
jgi:alpha-D-xyloside xylohydrolase